jgi:hypothetical protein
VGPQQLLALQRAVGNRATREVLARMQFPSLRGVAECYGPETMAFGMAGTGSTDTAEAVIAKVRQIKISTGKLARGQAWA